MEGFDIQTVIAVIALLTGLGFIFRLLLSPIYDRLSKLEAGQAKLESKLDKLLEQRS